MNLKSCDQINTKRIYLYGAGSLGRLAKRALEDAGLQNVVAFIDSFKSGELDGLPIIRFSDYAAGHDKNNLVIIASEFQGEIKKQLQEAKISGYLTCESFMKELTANKASIQLLKLANEMIVSSERFPCLSPMTSQKAADSYCFVMVAWGEEYLDMMMNYALPSMLSPNNFPKLAKKTGIEALFLYAPKRGNAIQGKPAFGTIETICGCADTHNKIPRVCKFEHAGEI